MIFVSRLPGSWNDIPTSVDEMERRQLASLLNRGNDVFDDVYDEDYPFTPANAIAARCDLVCVRGHTKLDCHVVASSVSLQCSQADDTRASSLFSVVRRESSFYFSLHMSRNLAGLYRALIFSRPQSLYCCDTNGKCPDRNMR
jgi:hypothetical protein